jgi:hypothetical protein
MALRPNSFTLFSRYCALKRLSIHLLPYHAVWNAHLNQFAAVFGPAQYAAEVSTRMLRDGFDVGPVQRWSGRIYWRRRCNTLSWHAMWNSVSVSFRFWFVVACIGSFHEFDHFLWESEERISE